jgi:hypothetical protein
MPVPNSIDELSPNSAENYPAGTEPVFPNLDNYIRFHAACIAQLRDEVAAGGMPLGGSMWWGGARSRIKANFKPEDGDLLLRVDYPALWQFVSTGGYPLVAEADWWADKAKRASFSSGDGATTFRLPDNNGKQKDSFGAAVKRGDGAVCGCAGADPGQPEQGARPRGGGHPGGCAFAHRQWQHRPGGQPQPWLYRQRGQGNPDGATDTYGAIGTNRSYVRYSKLQDAGAHAHDVSGTAAAAGSHTHEVSVTKQGGTEARGIATTGCHVMRVK